MALQVGIVGLPGSGKTTLFNALTTPASAASTRRTSAWRRSRTTGSRRSRAGRRAQGHAGGDPRRRRARDGPASSATFARSTPSSRSSTASRRARTPARSRDARARAARRRPRPRREPAGAGRKQAKSGDPALRKEVERLWNCSRISTPATRSRLPGELPPELDPLTTKPLIASRTALAGSTSSSRRSSRSCRTRMPLRSATAALRSRRHRPAAVRRARPDHFFTAGDTETRAWTLRNGRPRSTRPRPSTPTSRAASSAAR